VAKARFDWDAGNMAKCQKHGVTIAEIEALFDDDPHLAPDEQHSLTEERLIAVGRNRVGRPIFLVFTVRQIAGEEHVRPLSARYMHAKEIKRYEE